MTACAPLCAAIAGEGRACAPPGRHKSVLAAFQSLGGEMIEETDKIKMLRLPTVWKGTCGRQQQPVGRADFTHPQVGSRAAICRKRLPNAFCGRKPTPTLSAEKKMLRCITHQGGESHCIASVRPRVRRSGCRAAVYPTNQNTAAMRPFVGNERGQKPTPREPHMFHSSTEIELSEKHCLVPVSGRFAGTRDV